MDILFDTSRVTRTTRSYLDALALDQQRLSGYISQQAGIRGATLVHVLVSPSSGDVGYHFQIRYGRGSFEVFTPLGMIEECTSEELPSFPPSLLP